MRSKSNKISLKLDNIFSSMDDAVVIPRSTTGTLSSSFVKGLREDFNIDIAEKLPYKHLGDLEIVRYTNLKRKNNLKPTFDILFASCVDNDMSTYDAIVQIGKEIAKFTKNNIDVRDVGTPLIGTGAGRLDPIEVYKILSEIFDELANDDCRLHIYINEGRVYEMLQNYIEKRDQFEDESYHTTKENTLNTTNPTSKFIFKSNGNRINNDVVYPGLPFALFSHSYNFIVQPKTKYWRFGIRLSTTEEIEFFHPSRRYKQPEFKKYKDVHIGVGEWDNKEWTLPNRIQLAQYNFAGIEHLIGRSDSYNALATVNWNMSCDNGRLTILVDTVGVQSLPFSFPVGDEYSYFKVFAWADAIDFELDCQINILEGGKSFASSDAINDIFFNNTSRIADLIADSDTGSDYLDINKDVTAFAKIMASNNFQPPLAIALFGKWGSGKSFFMNKLKERIDSYAKAGSNSVYCKGIVQIHFNAWSYLDANLWASIITKIFEGLRVYITHDDSAKNVKNEIEKTLTKKLSITKEQIDSLETNLTSITEKITDLETKKELLAGELTEKINEINNRTLKQVLSKVNSEFDINKKITDALDSNESIQNTKDELKEILPEKYWCNPNEAYAQIKSKHTFIKEFFRRDKIYGNLIWLCIILCIIIIVPPFIAGLSDVLKNVNFSIPQIGLSTLAIIIPLWKRIEATYKRLEPYIVSFWNIKEQYNEQIENAIFENEQHEKALKLEIEQKRTEILVISQQIQHANSEKEDLDFRINHALATEALYAFIEKRHDSDEYKKHLGLVSIIRNDFEILSKLFAEHTEEAHVVEFREKFKNPLERIILYVDDLDRCHNDRVVEVLEAVNLLMAFPLFVVVVGVDPRWVKNALVKRHYVQFGGTTIEKEIAHKLEGINASDYLEKIFQIPFHLKEATDESVKMMLKILAQPKETSTSAVIPLENGEYDNEEIEHINPKMSEGASIENFRIVSVEQNRSTEVESEYLVLAEREIELMQDMSEIIGTNPRAIKRFVNVYKIVKAHEGLKYEIGIEEREFLVIMFLLALSIGPYQKLSVEFKKYISFENTYDKSLSVFLGTSYDVQGMNDLKHKLDVLLSDKKTYNVLQKEKISTFSYHNKFIQRFTFDDII